MTQSEINEEASCYLCLGVSLSEAQILVLLNAVSDNIGGGGAGGLVGAVNPEGVVTADPGTSYYNTANATFWYKATGSGNTGWVHLI